MVKLKHLKAYNTEDVPDHVVEEINHATEALGQALELAIDALNDKLKGDGQEVFGANVILCAFNRLHAAMIKHYISDDTEELKVAALVEARTLLKNIECLTNKEMWPRNDK
jgi:hypothetical protein